MGASVTVQQTYRFREDDGSLTAATWLGSGNGDDISRGTGTGNKFRIRFVVEETNGGNANNPWLLYASYQGGAYFQVTTTSSYIRLVASDYVADATAITTAALGWSGTYDPDEFDTNAVKNNNALQSEYGEPEYCAYIVDADVANGNEIDLRVYEAVGSPCDSYTDTARVTVTKGATEYSDSVAADAIIEKSVASSIDADAIIEVGQADSITADSTIEKSIEQSVTADSTIEAAQSGSITSDAAIEKSAGSSITADALLQLSFASSIYSDAIIFKPTEQSIDSDAIIEKTIEQSITADAYISSSAQEGYLAKAGSFNIDSSVTAGNDQSVTGVGFQPSIVLFWWSGSTASVDSVAGGTYNIGFGAGISSSSRFCVVSMSEDGQATSDTYSYQSTGEVIRCYIDTTTLDGLADLKSLDVDGFTLTIDDQFANDYRVSFLALGGTDLTDIYIGNKQRDSDLGNCAVTGVGFQPEAVIIASMTGAAASGGANQGRFSLGWATGSSNQGVVSGIARDNLADSDTWGYGYDGEVWIQPWASSPDNRDTFVSFDADGFTLNQLEGTNALYYHFICFAGGQYEVGALTTRTDGNDIEENLAGAFTPVAVLFASANRALSTQNSMTDHDRISIGAATATDERCVQAISDEDNLATTECAYTNQDDAVYAHVVDDAIEALMDIKSFDADGFTCVMDDTESSACWVTYLAIGASPPKSITADSAIDPSEWYGWSETWSNDVSTGGTGSVTADAIIEAQQSSSVVADAILEAGQADSVSADAIIESTIESSVAADSIILSTGESSVTADAIIEGATESSFSADAIIESSVESSVLADAIIESTEESSVLADAIIEATTESSITADAWIGGAIESSVTADATIKSTLESSITADAYIGGTGVGSINADAVIKKAAESSVSADSIIEKAAESSVTADAIIETGESGSVTADATIEATLESSINANAWIETFAESSVTADAIIERSEQGSVSADAIISRTESGSVSADATIEATIESSITADAIIESGQSGSIAANASISCVGKPVWVSPANMSSMGTNPILVFTIPGSPYDMHFRIELDTADTFDTGNYVKYETWVDTTGWEYHNGVDWQPFPAGGVSNTYEGNQCRYTVQDALSLGTWYRRVTGGKA